jgi:hypothetical protein
MVGTVQDPFHAYCTYLIPPEVVDDAGQKRVSSHAHSHVGNGLSEPRKQSFWNKVEGITKTLICLVTVNESQQVVLLVKGVQQLRIMCLTNEEKM